jgi:hypothetical protein
MNHNGRRDAPAPQILSSVPSWNPIYETLAANITNPDIPILLPEKLYAPDCIDWTYHQTFVMFVADAVRFDVLKNALQTLRALTG